MNGIEKEIEEMARVMAGCEKTCDECFAEYEKLFTQPIQNRGNHCQAIEYCTKLYKASYRNCKDKIVLSKEEYSDYLILQKNHEFIREEAKRLQADNERLYKNIGKFKEIVSKETAEKFYEFAKAWFEDDEQNDYFEEVKNLAKQYGVEIKE